MTKPTKAIPVPLRSGLRASTPTPNILTGGFRLKSSTGETAGALLGDETPIAIPDELANRALHAIRDESPEGARRARPRPDQPAVRGVLG